VSGLAGELGREIARLCLEAERRHALYRAPVVEHLFERGWRPLHARMGEGAEARAALTSVWGLMLESVVTGRFGVSSDAWRENGSYPDRYFPRLWLDTLPEARLPPGELIEAATALFNLGERLHSVSRAASNALAEALFAERTRLAFGGWQAAARRGLEGAGLVAPEGSDPAEWRAARRTGTLRLGETDPDFTVAAVVPSGGGEVLVEDALRPVRARARLTAAGLELVGIEASTIAVAAPEAEAPPLLTGRAPRLTLSGRRLVLEAAGGALEVGRTGALLPLTPAVLPSGLVAIGDALSQTIEAWRLEP